MNFFKKPAGANSYGEDAFYEVDNKPAAKPATESNGNTFGGVNLGGNCIELKVVRPEKFENVSQIADHLLKKRTVVLNLEATNKETARRLIDFLSGVAYSIDGQLKRVANNTYIITPDNVDVSNDASVRAEKVEEAPVAAPAPEMAPAAPADGETRVFSAANDGLIPDGNY